MLFLRSMIDSLSIMLPIALPIARQFWMCLVWFGVISVVVAEIWLLTPPFGISVYTVKATLNDKTVSITEMFGGSAPFVFYVAGVLAVLVIFRWISTVLERMPARRST